MTILVEDINDNVPYFAESNFTATVAEEGEYGSYVTDIQAYDDDVGENAYRLVLVHPFPHFSSSHASKCQFLIEAKRVPNFPMVVQSTTLL